MSNGSVTSPQKQTYIIGIAGGSASGKTSVSELIISNLDVSSVALISMDSFYKILTKEQIAAANKAEYDFDHPNAFDFDLLFQILHQLKSGQEVDIPIYDFKTHSRLEECIKISGASVVVFEGIFALYDQEIMKLMDLKLFVDADDDIRLARRLRRDIADRGRSLDSVLTQYQRFVKPSFDEFVRPTMKYADVIVPRGADNTVAINLLSEHISLQLQEKHIE
ncbi:hypothetical protein MP228_012926 [Amoeboaphelidium protococcarum]|nr:hypothetical protein MP228_012926 [Amoeboaphelidium protococcarum]